MVDILSEILCEQRFRDLRLYMYVKTGNELFYTSKTPFVKALLKNNELGENLIFQNYI